MKCNTCYKTVERKVGGAFRRYGRFVARHPWKVLIIVVAINCALGFGMVRFNQLINIEDVYTPINSQASQAKDKLTDMFPDLSGSNFLVYQTPDWGQQAEVIVKPNSGNILDVDFLGEVKKLHDFILNISTTDEDGNLVELSQICAKDSDGCAIDGKHFFNDVFLAQVAAKTVYFPYFLHPSHGPIYYEQIVGGANVSSGFLQSATMLLLRVNLRTDSEYYVETAKNWQDSFIDNIDSYHGDSFDIAYSHTGTVSLELHRNVIRDLGLFTLTFTLMVVYAFAATFTAKLDCVGQQCILGIGGVLAAGLAILAAFGLCSASGVVFVSVVGVVPFLIIGIGVDDMFIMMSGLAETSFDDDIETRIGDTMATSGISITVTSLTDLLAFAAGASSVFLGVRNFCIYCSVAVVFCYINQASMFLACLAINEQRTAANRHFATCRPVPTKNEARTDEKSTRYILCCTGQRPRGIRDTQSLLDKVPQWLIPKLVFPKFMKVIILIMFAGYLGASIYGITEMKEGLDLKSLVADDSYYLEFKNLYDASFPFLIPVMFVFESSMKYSDSEQIDRLLQSVRNEPTIRDDFEINWLSEFKKDAGYDNSSETAFVTSLKSFLNRTKPSRFQNDVLFDDINNVITYSRIYVMSESITDSQEQGKFMSHMRDLAAESSLPVYVHSGWFIFFEQFNAILPQTLQTVGIAVAAVFIVTCIFLPHPLMLLLITVTVAMITTGIFGFLHFLDRTLSSITMLQIIMSIGFSVDFSVHICHGYMISSGRNRQERTEAGILRSGAPIFHGAVSSILGVVVLAAGQSFITVTFFKIMTTVLVFAIAHALLLLPVMLSLIGPYPSETRSAADGINREYRSEQERISRSRNASGKYIFANPQYYSYAPEFRSTAYTRQVYNGNGVLRGLANGGNGAFGGFVNGGNHAFRGFANGGNGALGGFVNERNRSLRWFNVSEPFFDTQRMNWYKNVDGTYSIEH